MTGYPLKPLAPAAAVVVLLLALASFAADEIPLEKAQSLKGFAKLRWEILPEELAGAQELEDELWKLSNAGTQPLLLLAPYTVSDLALSVELQFPPRSSDAAAGMFFDYVYHEDLGLPSYSQLIVYPDGSYVVGRTICGAPSGEQRGRFKLFRLKPRRILVHLARLRGRLRLDLNSTHVELQEVFDGAGGFGFLVSPGSRVELSNFTFARYREMESPFKGIDPIKDFPPPS